MTGVLVALDFPTLESSLAMAAEVRPHVAGFKVGLQLMLGPDPHALEKVVDLGLPVFADVKLHDIPATAEKAAQQIGLRGARWMTVHASGGAEMLRSAVDGLHEGSGGQAGVLGVTVLTSLDDDDLPALGLDRGASAQVKRLASVAAASGVEGLICAVEECAMAKAVDPELTVITPGIRLFGGEAHDQKRPSTPSDAREAGADYIVVGRAITATADPAGVSAAITAEFLGGVHPADSPTTG